MGDEEEKVGEGGERGDEVEGTTEGSPSAVETAAPTDACKEESSPAHHPLVLETCTPTEHSYYLIDSVPMLAHGLPMSVCGHVSV